MAVITMCEHDHDDRERVEQALEEASPAFANEAFESALEAAEEDVQEAVDRARVEMEDGGELRLREKRELAQRVLAAYEPAELCLAPCSVESSAHPGLHLSSGPADEGDPVCAIPAEVPHEFHMCLPDARNRYVKCPLCEEIVAVRGKKRHIEAHLGINRTDPEERQAYLVRTMKDWLEARPSWGFEMYGERPVRKLAEKCIAKNRGRSSGPYNGWYRERLEAACEDLDLPIPPLTYTQAKNLVEKGDQPSPEYVEEPTEEDKRRVNPPTEGQENFIGLLVEQIEEADGADLLADVDTEPADKDEASDLIETLKGIRSKAFERKEKREREADPSEHVGGPGERVEGLVVTVEGAHEYESQYGEGVAYRMRTEDEDLLVWFTTSKPSVEADGRSIPLSEFEASGDPLRIRATVKEHDEYEGVAETIVKRVHIEGRVDP